MIKARTDQLSGGWLITTSNSGVVEAPRCPVTEPVDFSSDPAFGDFNLPMDGGSVLTCSHAVSVEDERDIADLRESLREDDFTPYEEFRRDELGL